MRTIGITLMLAVASAGTAAQTTEGAAQPSYDGELFRRTARFHNWAPVGEIREREAAIKEAEAELEAERTAVAEREEEVLKDEAAVAQRERDVLRDETAVAQRERDVLNREDAVSEHEEKVLKDEAAVSELKEAALREASQIRDRSVGIAWTAVVLGGGVGFWSVWRLQPSTVARLNQRRRTAEQGLASMRDERDEAQAQLRKKASALTAAKRKNTLLRKAVDGAEAKCRDAEAAVEETKEINTGLRHALDGMETRRRERDATIIRLRVDLDNAGKARDDADAKRRQAEAAVSRLNATISRLRAELEDAKREAASRATQEGMARLFLGVPAGASRNVIRAAWKRVARTVHPDHCRGPEAKRLTRKIREGSVSGRDTRASVC